MTRHHNHTEAGLKYTPMHTPRLRLKAKAPQSGYVDGAWWPHTDDLPAELPDLLAVLSVRLGPIDRVLYNISEWASAPSKVAIGGRTVRIDGYRNQPESTVEIIGLYRRRIVLLVVPPHENPDDAHTMMMIAAALNNATTVDGLLMNSTHGRKAQVPRVIPEQERWESEGGARCVPTLSTMG